MAKNHCDPAAGCKPKAGVSPANGKPMALVAKWMSVSIRGPAQWRSRKTASSQRGQEFTMYHHQDYILAHGRHSQPRTSRGQRSYKDKRCRQRSRKYETRGVAEERLARIWPGPTAVIARHHHCTGQLPEACCSSSVVSGRKANITGIIIKTSFLWNLRDIQTQMKYMNRVLCLKKKTCSEMNISWYHQPQVHRYCSPRKLHHKGEPSFWITAKCDGCSSEMTINKYNKYREMLNCWKYNWLAHKSSTNQGNSQFSRWPVHFWPQEYQLK